MRLRIKYLLKGRFVVWLPSILMMSLAAIFSINAWADNTVSGSDKLEEVTDNCRANYSINDGDLYIPCIEVLTAADGKPQFYAAELQQIPDTEPLQFSVTQITELDENTQGKSCVATYSVENGEVYLPCVDMVNSGDVELYTVILRALSDELLPARFALKDVLQNDSSRRVRRPNAKERIVLVDGISFERTNQCYRISANYPDGRGECKDGKSYNRGSYLLNDLRSTLLSKGVSDSEIKAFEWSGDMVTHGENLKTKFSDWFSDSVCQEGERCNVSFIAHSWGTIITTDFIASMAGNSTIKLRTVVTFGSPVTGAQIKWNQDPFWRIAIDKVTSHSNQIDGISARWVNLVNRRDLVAWDILDWGVFYDSPIAGMENLQPNGSDSTKGRLGERFPVNNSELDPKYLGTSIVRICALGGGNCVRGLGGDALKTILKSWGIDVPRTVNELITTINQEHSTSAYGAQKVVEYVTNRLGNYSWNGNGSIISYHGRDLPTNGWRAFGIIRDTVQLHKSSGKPVGLFQWQVNKTSCNKLKLYAEDLPSSKNSVDITIGTWSDRSSDITFSNVKLPFVLGKANTGWGARFEMGNGSWYVVKVALRNVLSQNVELNAICTTENPAVVSYRLGGGDSAIIDGGYKWNGSGSVISNMFSGSSHMGGDWPHGAFKDTLKVRRSPERPMVFFQWQHDSGCSSLTLDAPKLSTSQKRVDIYMKPWDAHNNEAQAFRNETLPYTLYDGSASDGSWSVIQMKFLNPVSKTATVTAKCPGIN